MDIQSDAGLLTRTSQHSVDQTVEILSALLKEKGITLFALVDHSGEAARVGLTMRPTKLLIFGDPRSGTPLMQASPTCAIDLPLKILVSENHSGATQLTYNSPGYLGARHQLPEDLLKNISSLEALVARVTH